jgi:MoaA/NifB/PqqE/SkfB family radical SAM enzyme
MPHPDRACIQLLCHCNMRCRFCDVPARRSRLAPDLARRLVDQLASLGVRYFDLTGGEPLLYAHLADLVAHVKARGGFCSVTTNGLALTPKTAQTLTQAGLDHLQMSLDGIGPTHDRLRGSPGAFAAAQAALPLLADFPGTKNLAVAVTSENVHELPAIEALADTYGLGLWFTPAAAYTDAIAAAIRLPDPDAIDSVSQTMRRPRSREKLGWIASAMRNGHDVPCKVPDVRYTVLADAALAPCAFLPGCGNLAQESLAAVAASPQFTRACHSARARAENACRNCYIWSTR